MKTNTLILLLVAALWLCTIIKWAFGQPTPVLPGIVTVTLPGGTFTSSGGYVCTLPDRQVECVRPTPGPTPVFTK